MAVIDPPRDYAAVVGALPEGASLHEDSRKGCHVTLWFVHDPAGYLADLPRMKGRAAGGKLWILWQKQSAGNKGGVTQRLIRESAIAVGLVDYKVCSVNATWSGLLFTCK